jgi:exosome complex exonuclease DIS3/RRP44
VEKWPFCHFIRVIGLEGDPKTEGDVILLENDIKFDKFSQAVLNCLPKEAEKW